LFIARLLVVRLTRNQVQMKELNLRYSRSVFAHFSLKYRLREGATLRSASFLNRESGDLFCSNSCQQPLGAATSVKPMWLQRSPTLLSIGPPALPKPNLWKLTERLFSTHSWRRPPKQWPTSPVQDATDRERKIGGYSAWGQIEGGRLVDS
jgi:hypothetical protein